MTKNTLIPNISVGDIILKDDITKYLNKKYTVHKKETEPLEYDSYDFYDDGIDVWTENNVIESICCRHTCYWKGRNLIRMNFNVFLSQYGIIYDSKDELFMRVGEHFQTQKVYDFDKLGLQIWVWRNLIRTVIVSKYGGDDE